MSKSWYRLMILVVMAVISGCNTDGDDINVSNKSASVKMGGLFPFTGSLNEKGIPRHQAALLATKHLTEAGYPVELVVADSRTNKDFAVEAARELVDKGNVDVLIGAASSPATIAVAEQVSIPRQVPQISYSSSSPLLTELEADKGQDFLFRTTSSDELQGVVLAQLAFETGYRRVSVLYIEGAYGEGLTEVFTTNFKELGQKNGEIVRVVSGPHEKTETESDFSDDEVVKNILLANLQGISDEPTEVLIAISLLGYAKIFLKQAVENNFFDKFLFVDGTKSKKIVEIVGATALEGMCGTAPGVDKETDSWREFEKSYRDEYRKSPEELYQPHAYDAVVVAGLAAYAAEAIGETITPITIREYLRRVNDTKDGQTVTAGPEGLKRGMKMLDSGFTINYQGASGNVDFDENGDVIAPVEIWCYEGGQIVTKNSVIVPSIPLTTATQ
ncbi:MAG TPA: hypothetical protein ENG03_08285 [Thioploca sp.]|nr:MAG: hypothetical protein B6247_24520 [Beggiatoa sp. 4572_84]RKZ62910.1 MAG: hypothetical protein DRR08_04825 [Gammaproteobacteria bacterium]HDN27076.1 hypothetical protein [Thioploca sp.]